MTVPTQEFVQDVVDDMRDNALELKDDTLAAIDDINVAWEAMLLALQAINYVPGTEGITFNYTAPTLPSNLVTTPTFTYTGPAAVSVPSASSVAIGDARWNEIWARVEGLQDRVQVREEEAAAEDAAWRGHAQLDETQAAKLRTAQFEGAQRTNDNALTSGTEQAKAERDDAKDLTGLSIDYFKSQLQGLTEERAWLTATLTKEVDTFKANLGLKEVELRSRAEERGWKQADVTRLLEEADKTTSYVLERTRLIEGRAIDIAEKIAMLLSGVTQAFLQAVDAQASASNSVGYDYNTTRSCECDEIVI